MDNVELKRDCEAVGLPKGQRLTLPKGSAVRIVQERAGSYIVSTPAHLMYRIDAKDADALGAATASVESEAEQNGGFNEQLVWDTLKTVYDPELPVNIVDLGLIYSCVIKPAESGNHLIHVRMTTTSPGCSMSDVLRSEVKTKLSRLPSVIEANVEVVFDPPWSPDQLSREARMQLNMELKDKSDVVQISSHK